jgi:hypothetical protein
VHFAETPEMDVTCLAETIVQTSPLKAGFAPARDDRKRCQKGDSRSQADVHVWASSSLRIVRNQVYDGKAGRLCFGRSDE